MQEDGGEMEEEAMEEEARWAFVGTGYVLISGSWTLTWSSGMLDIAGQICHDTVTVEDMLSQHC